MEYAQAVLSGLIGLYFGARILREGGETPPLP